jgi:two-component system chemotaxis response regulator CheB
MPTIRVLVVEDSSTVRAKLLEVLASDPGLEVVGEAKDGRQAIELCRTLRPDVITMDMVLPTMSGLSATEQIMAHYPTPILVVSSSTNRGELFKTYEALAAGAVEVLEKPTGDEEDGAWERHLLSTVKLVSRIRVITHPRARLGLLGKSGSVIQRSAALPRRRYEVVAIGASTGGPGAVLEILQKLPLPYSLPILLVLHIGEPFGIAFADWLDAQTGLRVAYAQHGEPVSARAGQVCMAPPDSHMAVRNGRLVLTRDAPRHSCRPSVDALFESVAREYGAAAVGVLLTGMGRDGAAGLLEMRRQGALTIGQDESSSVVYGMPREAMLLGAVERELSLNEISPLLHDVSALTESGLTP